MVRLHLNIFTISYLASFSEVDLVLVLFGDPWGCTMNWGLKLIPFISHQPLRSALVALLCLHPKSLIILAPVCSGFSFMCSSLAQRFFWCPEGVESLRWVRAGNIMANRVTLLCWLCAALGHTFLLEQPGSARLAALPRWQYFCRRVCWAAQLKHYLFPLEFV